MQAEPSITDAARSCLRACSWLSAYPVRIMDDEKAARRRAQDRERKRRTRAAERAARAEAAAKLARACEPSSPPSSLADVDDVRAVLEYALKLVAMDVTGSPTNRARVVAQVGKSAADVIVQRELSDRLDAVEQVLEDRAQR